MGEGRPEYACPSLWSTGYGYRERGGGDGAVLARSTHDGL